MPKLNDTSSCWQARRGKRWAQVVAVVSCLMAMMAGYCASEAAGAAAQVSPHHRQGNGAAPKRRIPMCFALRRVTAPRVPISRAADVLLRMIRATNQQVQAPGMAHHAAPVVHCSPATRVLVTGFTPRCGLGCELTSWSFVLAASLMSGRVLVMRQDLPNLSGVAPWTWEDRESCRHTHGLRCYFPAASPPPCLLNASQHGLSGQPWPPQETNDDVMTLAGSVPVAAVSYALNTWREPRNWHLEIAPPLPRFQGLANPPLTFAALLRYRRAAMELLFRHPAPWLGHEICRIMGETFGQRGPPPREDLIAVHIRWGDRAGIKEVRQQKMRMFGIDEYVDAVHAIVRESGMQEVNVLVVTEDTSAIRAFRAAANGTGWAVFSYEAASLSHDTDLRKAWHRHIDAASQSNGKLGTQSIATLYMALQATFYVGTLSSNWSKLLDMLRVALVDPVCNSCTRFRDLEDGKRYWETDTARTPDGLGMLRSLAEKREREPDNLRHSLWRQLMATKSPHVRRVHRTAHGIARYSDKRHRENNARIL